MIYLEATLKVAPGKQREFNDLLKNDFVPVGSRHGMRLVAAYANITGLQDVATDLWEYDDLAQMQQVEVARAGDPAFRDAYKKLTALSPWETVKLLTPLRYHPADALKRRSTTASVIMSARLRVEAGQVGPFLKIFQNDFLPVAQQHGMELIGAFMTSVGRLSEVLDLWRFDSVAAYGEVTRSLAGDPQFRKLVAEIRQVAPEEEINLHVPLPYSPFR